MIFAKPFPAWYARSRLLYNKLRDYLKLPSQSSLKRITRITKNTEDLHLFTHIFKNLPERSRTCTLIVDEIYVKSSLQYCGGEIFGYAMDYKDKQAKTILSIMVKCLFGGKKFVVKLIPCYALTAAFQFQCVSDIIDLLNNCGARVISIINDNNRINQSFFRMFTPFNEQTPWIVRNNATPSQPLFLLCDPVHLIKNLRNNWLSEKPQNLIFPLPDSTSSVAAKWSDLRSLFRHENETMGPFSLSKLTKASLNPTNIEKQKVSLARNIFNEKTSSALRNSLVTSQSSKETADCIDAIIQLWKVFSTKSKVSSSRFNDPDRIAFDKNEAGCKGFKILADWASIAIAMKPSSHIREKKLTKDTAEALRWTCESFQCLVHYLLNVTGPLNHEYMCLGFYLQDDLERQFGYFRMAAGSNYFLTVQDIFATNSIDKTKLLLDNCPTLDTKLHFHHCPHCKSPLTENEVNILTQLEISGAEGSVSRDDEMAIFYIAGYIASKHPELVGDKSASAGVQAYFRTIDRGRLCCPSDIFLNLVLFAYVFVIKLKSPINQLCRNSLVATMASFPARFQMDINVPKKALLRLSNLLLKKLSENYRESINGSQSKRKLAKLSSAASV